MVRNFKGEVPNSNQRFSVANMIELLLKSFFGVSLAFVRSLEGSERPVEVPGDVTQHLVVYRTAVGTRTNRLRLHGGFHPGMTQRCNPGRNSTAFT